MSGFGWPTPISPSEAHFAREEATTARQSSELAASRQYQVRAADMAAAGLNPILAASQGSGAMPTTAQGVAKASSMSIDPTAKAQTHNIQADTDRKVSETEFVNQQTSNARLSAAGIAADNVRKKFDADYSAADAHARGFTALSEARAAELDRRAYDSDLGGGLRGVERFGGGASSAVSAARGLVLKFR